MWPWISRVVEQATRDTATGFKLNERNPMLKARPLLGCLVTGAALTQCSSMSGFSSNINEVPPPVKQSTRCEIFALANPGLFSEVEMGTYFVTIRSCRRYMKRFEDLLVQIV